VTREETVSATLGELELSCKEPGSQYLLKTGALLQVWLLRTQEWRLLGRRVWTMLKVRKQFEQPQ
jgi:hypothetical protein